MKIFNYAPVFFKITAFVTTILITTLLLIATSVSTTLGHQDPELTWISGYDASADSQVQGLALIQKTIGWVKVYQGETYTMSESGHVNRYEGNNAGLDAEYDRVLAEETPNLVWTGSVHGSTGNEVEGLALIEIEDDWIRVYEAETYTMTEDGHINMYTGNNAGLDVEYTRLMSQETPALTWLSSDNAYAGTTVEGLALIQKGTTWIKVYDGDTYTMNSSGHVNLYSGNNAGLDAEYDRIKNSQTEPGNEVPELEWQSWEAGQAGHIVEGLALIEKDDSWIKIYSGYTYTMTQNGNIHKYIGNNAGLDAEYNRLTE